MAEDRSGRVDVGAVVGRLGAGPAGTRASAVLSHPAAMLGAMAAWTAGEVLGFDFETTGIDRFNDVPVSYALVHVVDGVVVTELVRSHRPGPRDPGGGDRGARHHDGAGARRGHAAASRRSGW